MAISVDQSGGDEKRHDKEQQDIVGTVANIADDFGETDNVHADFVVCIPIADALDERIRDRYTNDEVSVHIIGFAKVIGDISHGTHNVLLFFVVSFFITAALVYAYSHSILLTLVPLICSLVAVTWQVGAVDLLGFGIDPLSILVPFLIFAIAVSHAVQMVRAYRAEVFDGMNELEA